jgi:GNAT superfamily N-acetyltransferase
MNAAVTIRRGDRRDRAFVLDLGRRVATTSVSSIRPAAPPLVDVAFTRLLEYIWERDHDLLVAEDAGVPIGFALVVHDEPDDVTLSDQAFIAYMAVEPDVQRQGAGAALLAAAEALARERGVNFLSLMVTEDNQGARELYGKTGFATERRMMTKAL